MPSAPLRVVDAHVHFWDPSLLRYPWLDEEPGLRRAFLPEDFTPLQTGAVDAVVFVEANATNHAREVQWIERLAAAESRIAGIVAMVDLLGEPARDAALDVLKRSPRVVGVRHNIQGRAPRFATSAVFVRGVRAVTERGFPFDLCITADQLPDVIELAESCPDARFVLDHCGKPAIRANAFEAWAEQIAQLAANERVWCKLSGLLTEAGAEQRDSESLRRYVEHVMSCFGPPRLIYGSDWPVSTLGGGAEHWRAIVDELTTNWSDADRQALFADNAIRFYGLELNV